MCVKCTVTVNSLLSMLLCGCAARPVKAYCHGRQRVRPRVAHALAHGLDDEKVPALVAHKELHIALLHHVHLWDGHIVRRLIAISVLDFRNVRLAAQDLEEDGVRARGGVWGV